MKSAAYSTLLAGLCGLVLASCGGSDSRPYSSMVSFGDSLSDVGSYEVGTIAAAGGGQYTVNSNAPTNWTEQLSVKLKLTAPCAAQTGLDGNAALGLSVMPPVNHPGCLNYAQGGSRVTDPYGYGNKFWTTDAYAQAVGQLTVPVVTQVANHLAATGGSFSGGELVTVMAGGNDAFLNAAAVGAGAATPTQAATAMATAAAELAGYIQTQIIAKGAKRVIVLNIPDMANTPYVVSQGPAAQALFDALVTTFNSTLATALSGVTQVRLIDVYAASRAQVTNPSAYGLTNVTGTACDLSPAVNFLQNGLLCTASTLNAGDVSHFLFADTVHPTPYGHLLISQLVQQEMTAAGWL